MCHPPYRSALYIPGSNARALEKARTLPVDAIIFDLEDAVTAAEKDAARDRVSAALGAGGYGARQCLVRINGLDTAWGCADAEAATHMGCNGVLLPKVETAAQLDALAARTADLPIWAMMETPRGILNASDIAAHPKLCGMVMGTNDLAKELKARFRPDRLPLMASLSRCVLAARAEGRILLDGVYNAFRDDAGLRAECLQGRDLGFDGKTLIHPAQVDSANAIFAPTAEEIDLAHRQIAAFDTATAQGLGVAVVDGQIVEALHIAMARDLLAKVDAIEIIQAE